MNIKRPYKIQVWEESWNGTQWDECQVVELGSNTSEYWGRAKNIEFTKDVYGEEQLSFSLDKFQINELNEKEENYLIKYLYNEAKVKLWFDDGADDKWHEFIVKDIKEDHNAQLTFTYNCQSLATYELGKIGYDINFSLDNENAIQNAGAFMEEILRDTEWKYLPDSRTQLIETTQERCYSKSIDSLEPVDLYRFSFNNGNDRLELQIDTNSETYEDGTLYFPESQQDTEGDIFVYWARDLTDLIDSYLIPTDKLFIYKTGVQPTLSGSVTEYSMQVPKKSLYSEYVNYIDYSIPANSIREFCNKFKYDNDTKEGYSRVITRVPDFGYEETSDSAPHRVGILAQTATDETTTYIEDPLYSGDKYRYLSFTGAYHRDDVLEIYKGIDDSWYGTVAGEDITIEQGSVETAARAAIQTAIKVYYKKSILYDGSIYYMPQYNLSVFEDDQVYYTCIVNPDELSNINISSVEQFFSYDRTLNKLEILGYGNSLQTGQTLSPAQTNYYFYKYGVYTSGDMTGYSYDSETGVYQEKTSEWEEGEVIYKKQEINYIYSYEMYRSLEEGQSNCFNLTQSVAELFECWARYIINHEPNGRISIDNGQRKKFVTLKSDYGKKNQLGFTYGLNATNITREIQTTDLATKLIVENCENQYSSDGIISLSYATDNLSKENVIYNFDYFIQKKLLNGQQVSLDLYNIDSGEFVPIGEDIRTKGYIEGNSTGPGFLRHLGKLNAIYDSIISNELGTGATSLTNQLAQAREKYNAYAIACATDGYALTPEDEQYNTLEKRREKDLALKVSYQLQVEALEAKINELNSYLSEIVKVKREITKIFNKKYARFIQEGTWSGTGYVDHNSYYNDALKVSLDSAKPNIDYSISAVDLGALPGYDLFNYEVGDKTWIEDVDYFGYDKHGKPYHEAVIVKEISYNLDDPTQTQITIANYSSKFEDLFQRLNATVQSYALNQNIYNRAEAITQSGALKYASLQESFNKNKEITLIDNDSVTIDNYGITVTNASNPDNIVRLVSGGIVLSNDGGATYQTGIYSGEINTSLIKSGIINTENLTIRGTNSSGSLTMTGGTIVSTGGDFQITLSPGQFKIEDLAPLQGSDGQLFYIDAENKRLHVDGMLLSIGNWNITDDGLAFTDDNSSYYIQPTNTDSDISWKSKTDWRLLLGSKNSQESQYTYNFGIDSNGAMYSTSGNIGGWTIGENGLYYGSNTSTTSPTYYFGQSDISKDATIGNYTTKEWRILMGASSTSYNFGINKNGDIYCQNGVFNGTIRMNYDLSEPGILPPIDESRPLPTLNDIFNVLNEGKTAVFG